MPTGLLFDCDQEVAQWQANRTGLTPCKYDKAIGLLDSSGVLIGAIVLYNWNSSNIELGYHGEKTLSLGIVRCLSRYAISVFNPARVTVIISKKNRTLMRSLQKLGFKLEGTSRCYFGHLDCNRNTGVRFVLFRTALDKLAGIPQDERQCL